MRYTLTRASVRKFPKSVVKALKLNLVIRWLFWTTYIVSSNHHSLIEINRRALWLYRIPYPTSGIEIFDRSGEIEVLEDLLSNSGENVVYDIGANVGLYAVIIGLAESSDQIIAFEPFSDSVEAIKQNADVFGLEIDIKELAITNHTGESYLKIERSSSQNRLVDSSHGPDEKVEVETTTIDNLVEKGSIPIPNVIKIDIEGSEKKAFEGMKNTISSPKCEVIYCEMHEDKLSNSGTDREDIHELLTSFGFDQLAYPFNRDVLKAVKSGNGSW